MSNFMGLLSKSLLLCFVIFLFLLVRYCSLFHSSNQKPYIFIIAILCLRLSSNRGVESTREKEGREREERGGERDAERAKSELAHPLEREILPNLEASPFPQNLAFVIFYCGRYRLHHKKKNIGLLPVSRNHK